MSKRPFKSQASSARASPSAFGLSSPAFGASQSGFQTAASPLSYIAEQPDLSGITNPQIVVEFKNLGKKDSTTKAKALEELQEQLSSAAGQDGIETNVLEAWASLYPRTSIDKSRRVRQLAHSLQGWITTSSGKRIVPYLPKIIGPWLAGTYDSDKGAARSAQDALQAAFSTPERVESLWRVYRKALLDYVEDAMLVQTQQTLSDERTTSPDDSEAKHVRVVSTAALILLQLIKRESTRVGSSDNAPSSDYAKLLNNGKLWEYAYNKDASLRRAVYALILPTMTHLEDHIDFKVLSTCFLAKALHTSQLGSSGQYAEALLSMTQIRPQLWTSDYSSKTHAARRLFQFFKKGSQRGPESFWTSLGQLIRLIPVSAWSASETTGSTKLTGIPSLKDAEFLLEALHEGVTSTEEPRQNASPAWSTYAATALWLIRDLEIDDRQTLLLRNVYPIVEQGISQIPANTQWDIPALHSTQICSRILVSLTAFEDGQRFAELWRNLSSDLIASVKISLPESSKDFRSSQDAVVTKAGRLFKLQQQVARSITPETSARTGLDETTASIVNSCVNILQDRNGKPYGAAGTIIAALSTLPAGSTSKEVDDFLRLHLSSLIASPSGPLLISLLLQCTDYPSYHSCFARCVNSLLSEENIPNRDDLLVLLLQQANRTDLSESPGLIAFIKKCLELALDGDQSRWKVVNALLGNKKAAKHTSVNSEDDDGAKSDLSDEILNTMMDSLSISEKQDAALRGFENLLSGKSNAQKFVATDAATHLLPKLLLASDSHDEEIATRASDLSQKVQSLMRVAGSSTIATSTSDLLQQQFAGVGQLLSVFGMVELAEMAWKDSDNASRPELFASLLPSAEHWEAALKPFIDQGPSSVSAITSPLQGTVYIIEHGESVTSENLLRDSDDFSVAMRLALYVTQLLSTDTNGIAGYSQSGSLYLYYPQVLQLINDTISFDSSSLLWLNPSPEVIDEAVDTVAKGQKLIQNWIQESVEAPGRASSIVNTWKAQFSRMQGASPQAYVLGLCFSSIMTEYTYLLGPAQALAGWKTEISSMHRSNDIVQSAAILSILQDILPDSAEGKKLCNELIADVTGLKDPTISATSLRPLILVNMLLHGNKDLLSTIPTQRVVFLFQNIVRILADDGTPYPIAAEIYKLLSNVVLIVSDIYGDYWDQILDTMVALWENEPTQLNLSVLNSSFSMYARLRSLLSDEPNEDLVEALKAKTYRLDSGLLHVLESWDNVSSGTSQAGNITIDSLARQLRTVDALWLDSVENLYPLLKSEQSSVQTAAYELLHRAVPAQQELVSLDIALEKKTVHLPAELLAIIAQLAKAGVASKPTRAFLLSWTVVFDNFTNASFKLQEMYHADIKSSGHVPALLDMICEILRITSGRPVDGSKFDITNVSLKDQDLAEKEALSVAVYLYYKSLLHVPDLVKEWYIEQKNRIKSPLESWTQKHISPLIVASSLEAATEWAATQDQDDRPVSIKASPKGSELVASIGIDEESPPISLAISLPGAYPLEQAIVTSRNRVGVSDKNWQSWMRTFQIIIFSTGNLIEGLIAFRRNVQGALKGQTECAICYSIIGTDMKTPDKKCGTCKNTFHSVCLFRWFKSSNSSSCPLCRNNFNYA